MDKKTTQNCTTISRGTVELPERSLRSQREEALPSKATIAFLRQFARVYSYEPALGSSLGGMMVN